MGRRRSRFDDGYVFGDYANLPSGRSLDDIIRDSDKKPPYVSDARWRIELARRRNKNFYDYMPEENFSYRYIGGRKR